MKSTYSAFRRGLGSLLDERRHGPEHLSRWFDQTMGLRLGPGLAHASPAYTRPRLAQRGPLRQASALQHLGGPDVSMGFGGWGTEGDF